MNKYSGLFPLGEVRDDFVPKGDYTKQSFADWEAERLWPYVWQLACRLEEIPEVGNYYTYDIIDDSIIVVRTDETTISAFHNACSHRGLPLTKGVGSAKSLVCPFHGWKYELDGQCSDIIDEDDWGSCLSKADVGLKSVKVGVWGGAVFINMDPDCQPLEEFINPVDKYCDNFEFDKLRYRWYKTTIMPANWKLVLDAFNEFYHVQKTHRQMLAFTDDYSNSAGFGRHSKVWYTSGSGVPFNRSPRLTPKEEPDFRNYVLNFVENFDRDLKAMVTPRAYKAAQRLRTEVLASASPEEVLTKWVEFHIEAAHADGAGWPENLTPEYMQESGLDWHVFPNTIFLHGSVDGVLWYRVRPNGNDPDSAIFDIWSLERYGEGQEPKLEREFYENWRDAEWPRIYMQDFENLDYHQRGMKSRGFDGGRANPVQERAIPHFHRTLRRFMNDPHQHPDPESEE